MSELTAAIPMPTARAVANQRLIPTAKANTRAAAEHLLCSALAVAVAA